MPRLPRLSSPLGRPLPGGLGSLSYAALCGCGWSVPLYTFCHCSKGCGRRGSRTCPTLRLSLWSRIWPSFPWIQGLVLFLSLRNSSVTIQFTKVMSDSLWPHGLQHARLPRAPLSPEICSNSCPLSQWCYLTTSSLPPHFPFVFSLSQHQGLF